MEERQTKIREGAGLEESRLNVEFIEWMKKYSTPLLLVIIVIGGGYFLWNYYKRVQERGTDEAFAQLDAANNSRNPTSLVRVADEKSVLAVPHSARLAAADLHLNAARNGVPIGVTLDNAKPGILPEGTLALTPEQRLEELTKAEALYKQVADAVANDPNRFIHAISALNGLAACAEMRNQPETARGFYQQVITISTAVKFDESAALAQKMIDSLDSIKNPPKLYAEALLPKDAAAIQPFTSPLSNIQMGTKDGTMIRMGADGKIIAPDAPAPGATPGTPIELTPVPAPVPEGAAPAPAPVPSPAVPAAPAPVPEPTKPQ